jgi:histone deacetylase 1/2
MASYGVDTNWYGDTGATDHITSELNSLTMKEKYKGRDQIHTANGQGMNISHVGHAIVKSPSRNLHLNNVLHVPNATKNLVSIHRLTKDNNVFLEFHPWYFYVKDQATKKVLLKGRCSRGLYPLISSSLSKNKQVFIATKLPASRWHNRLGHPSYRIVQQVLSHYKLPNINNVGPESVCDSCQKAKSHQLPYMRSSSVSTTPLQLVFSDVWGPAPSSAGRYTYYVSFIDDFSKYSWIYLLKKKSDVFQVFHNFQKLVEWQFDKKILAIQSNWGGEYERLNSFFQKIGIENHVSCPHAHQQNGSAERKHRHNVEVGLALLAHASMPLKFWDEAFQTATYLINMLPSKVIDNETPMERLLHKTPDYASLRTFGCACWPNLRPYNTRKLAFRSKQCVFIGYSPLHKGVKCLEINSGRVYISRDVVFL